MGALWSFIRGKPKKPVSGPVPRVKSIFTVHFRGLIGFILPLIVLPAFINKSPDSITMFTWMMMFWFLLWQPVNIPVVGLIPIFMFPLFGVLSTDKTAECYFNDTIALLIIGGMLALLMNNSGVDRRIALSLLCSGDACQFSGKRLVFKTGVAAFFLSFFCNRLIVTSTLVQYVTPPLMSLQSSTARYRSSEPCYDQMRYIINNAIQTSSSIGSIVIIHAATSILAFKAIFCGSTAAGKEYPDLFNYLQYSSFAFPVAFLAFVLNLSYHMLLINWVVSKTMSASSMSTLRNSILKYKNDLPKKVTAHEKLTVLFTIFSLAMLIFRWSTWLNMGWTSFRKSEDSPEYPVIKDAAVAAIFVIALHILPRGIGFLKYFSADTKSELPPLKPESPILWWRFVDKNTNYGYFFLLGAGLAIYKASESSTLAKSITEGVGKYITDYPWHISIFLVCLISIILANIMPGTAACIIFLPFVLSMAQRIAVARQDAEAGGDGGGESAGTASVWPDRVHLGALGVGIASTFGFMFPFMYTPAYFCHKAGNVPKRKMINFSLMSVVICLIVLWLALLFWAPVVWNQPISLINVPIKVVEAPPAGVETTPATEGDSAGAED